MRKTTKIGRLSVAMVLVTLSAGCDFNATFRQVAVPSVHSGVTQILNGLVDGVFAVIDPTTTTTTTSGN